MSASLNLHYIKSMTIQKSGASTLRWTKITCLKEDDSVFEITVFGPAELQHVPITELPEDSSDYALFGEALEHEDASK